MSGNQNQNPPSNDEETPPLKPGGVGGGDTPPMPVGPDGN